jgi:hypothetical protein
LVGELNQEIGGGQVGELERERNPNSELFVKLSFAVTSGKRSHLGRCDAKISSILHGEILRHSIFSIEGL